MSTEKYPAELVEKVAKALHAHDWPEYTWGPPAEEALRERFRERAIAALDALGLREEWAVQLDPDYTYFAPNAAQAEAAIDMWGTIPRERRTIQHRFTLETPWEVVTDE